MCGIVGILRMKGKDRAEQRERDTFTQLLHTGIVRGFHGTGIMVLDENGYAKTVKSAGPPFALCQTKEYSQFWDGVTKNPPKAIIGHNRLATSGDKVRQHSHPFVKKHIVMVHNGTLESGTTLPNFKDFKVDSEALCNGTAELGIQEALKKTSGAYAIVYIDTKEKTVNMIRNAQRPLFVCFDAFASRVIFASEKEHLHWITSRNSIIGTGVKIQELPTNTLWTFNFDDNFIDPKIKYIEGRVYQSHYNHNNEPYSNEFGYWDSEQNKWISRQQLPVTKTPALLSLPADNTIIDIVDEFMEKLHPSISRQTVLNAVSQIEGVKSPTDDHSSGGIENRIQEIRAWQFAKNPRLKEIYPNGKNYEQKNELVVVEMLPNGGESQIVYKVGDKLTMMVNDHVIEDEKKENFVVVGATDEIQNARIHVRVKGGETVNELFEAAVVEVEICRFMIPRDPVADSDGEIIIWAKSPKILPANEANPSNIILH